MTNLITKLANLHFKKKMGWQEIERFIKTKPGNPTENAFIEEEVKHD